MSLLRAISPFGPIFGKELRTTARRRRNYLLRVAYLGGLLLFLMLAYLSTRNSYGMGASARVQRQAMLGFQFFMTFCMFSVVTMALIGPILTCTAINGERLHKTMHVLLMTPITSWQIVSGKLLSRLLTAFTLIGLSLPVLALVRLLGGVELEQMTAAVALALATAAFTASIGLLLSTLVNRAYAAILLSYGLMLLLYMFVPFIIASSFIGNNNRGFPWMSLLSATNPFMCAGMLASGQTRMLAGLAWGWPTCVALHLAGTGVLLVLSALLVRRAARKEGEAGPSVGAPEPEPVSAILAAPQEEIGAIEGNGQATAGASAGAQPQKLAAIEKKRKTRVARVVSDNPVLWHEIRRPLMPKRWQARMGAIICIGLLLLTYWALSTGGNDLADEETHMGYAMVFHALLTLLMCVLAGTAIAQEKESDTWTLLLTAPVSGAAVVWGKILGVLRRSAFPLALILGHFTIFVICDIIELHALLSAMWVIVTFNLFWVATGVYLSLRISKVTFAVILNLLLPIIAYALTPLVLAMIDLTLDSGGELAELVLLYLPFYYLATLMEDTNGTVYMPVFDMRVQWWTMARLGIFIGLLHVAGFLALTLHMIVRFNAIVGRAPQVAPVQQSGRDYGSNPAAPVDGTA